MIEGAVSARREAVVTLFLQGPAGQTREVDAVIDTGFTGNLTLPLTIVRELGLPATPRVRTTLADGRRVRFNAYTVTVLWDGRPRRINAIEVNNVPLVGMALLEWHNLNIDVQRGGRVAIQANP